MPRKTPGRHVALLRGINVGGKNKLPMKDLMALVTELGATEVKTYIQSGNVVFSASATLARGMSTVLADAIEAQLGLTVPVVVRTAAQMQAVVEGNPFLAAGLDPKTLHVGFLASKPSKAKVAALDPERSPPDAFEVRGQEIFLHFPNGVARTKLTNAYLDRTLGTTSTVRNWKTVNKLHEMLGG